MRKIILFIHSSFNGVVTGDPSKDKTDIDWERPSTEEGREYLLKAMETVDTLLLGRGTYEDFVAKWPSMGVSSPLSEKINTAHKVVVTGNHAIKELHWGGFEAPKQLNGSDVEDQIASLKNSDGGDIMIFGSPVLVRTLTDADLIDEYLIKIHPVLVNVGEHLFDNLKEQKDLTLLDVQTFSDSCMVVRYQRNNI